MPATYKVSTNTSSLGTAAKFGAADINRITQTLNGDADIDSPDINSPLTLHSSKIFINNPANTFAYTIIASAIAANRNLIIPLLTGPDTLAVLSEDQTFSNKTLDSSCIIDDASLSSSFVTLTGSQTLTNKTLTQPIVSTISNTGILTLPTNTDTLVGRDTTDTLTNKTLTLPVISAVSNSGTITFPTGTLTLSTLTGSETLTNKTLTAPIISTISNSGTITIPTGTNTLTTLAGTENLTNKTLDSTNTISSATSLPTVTIVKGGTGQATATLGFDALSPMTTAGDVIIGAASGTRTRLAIGTANKLLRVNAGATAPEWASTLSGLTLTAPVISTISNTGTVTLPTATDTLVGKATTDVLTNKTIDAELNTLDHTTVMPSKKKVGWYAGQNNPATAYGTTGMWNGACSANVTGSGAVSVITRNSAGTRFNYTTGTTINSIGGFRINSVLLTERDLNPVTEWKIQLGQTADCRMAFGLSSISAASTAGADPLANLSGVMFFYDSGVDTEWMIAQNSGGASSDRTTIINIATADTAAHTFAIRAVEASSKFQYAYGYTNLANATWVDINTVIPAASTGLGWTQYMENLTAVAKTWAIYWMQGTQDA